MNRCLRVLITGGSVVTLLVSISAIIIGIYYFVAGKKWQTLMTGTYLFYVLVAFIIIAVLLFVTSIVGICGTCREIKGCVGFYFVTMMIWSVALILISVLAVVMPAELAQVGCKSMDYKIISDLNQVSQVANMTLCRTNCQCYFKNPPAGLNTQNNNTNLPVNAQSCPYWSSVYDYSLLMELEKSMNCSGWCTGTQTNYFKFLDVNMGAPKMACFDAVYEWLSTFAKTIYVSGFSFSFIMILMVMVAYCYLENVNAATSNAYENDSVAVPKMATERDEEIAVDQ